MVHHIKKFPHINLSNITIYLLDFYRPLFKTLYIHEWSVGCFLSASLAQQNTGTDTEIIKFDLIVTDLWPFRGLGPSWMHLVC